MGTILNIGDTVSLRATVDTLYADGTARAKIGCWFLDRDSITLVKVPKGTRPGTKLKVYGKVTALASGPLDVLVRFGAINGERWMSKWSTNRED